VSSSIIYAGLIGVLSAAAYSDVKTFRIPNAVTVPAAMLGLALNSSLPEGLGLTPALYGFAIGLFGLYPLYLLRVWGAGDVKLMAVVGAFLGPVGLFGCLLWSLVIGGITAVIVAWHRKRGRVLLENLRCMVYQAAFNAQLRKVSAFDGPAESAGKVAYAIPILLGTLGYLIYQPHV
jgi:prepilin peptidase CpaA